MTEFTYYTCEDCGKTERVMSSKKAKFFKPVVDEFNNHFISCRECGSEYVITEVWNELID
tara:strand:- start:2 stop:181 length:180 start_codon:yes stop_codon:yes gene_type:complete